LAWPACANLLARDASFSATTDGEMSVCSARAILALIPRLIVLPEMKFPRPAGISLQVADCHRTADPDHPVRVQAVGALSRPAPRPLAFSVRYTGRAFFRECHGHRTAGGRRCLLHQPWLLVPGSLLLGVSGAAGNLSRLDTGHNDFAPRGEETRYMALHVTLTGMRGLVAPPLTIGLYLPARGLATRTLGRTHCCCRWLVIEGARRFHRCIAPGSPRSRRDPTPRGKHNSLLAGRSSVDRFIEEPVRMTARKIDVRPYSKLVFDGAKQTASRAMLRAVGFEDRDFRKPQVGIARPGAT
jgi:hypothetical protein